MSVRGDPPNKSPSTGGNGVLVVVVGCDPVGELVDAVAVDPLEVVVAEVDVVPDPVDSGQSM